MSKFNDVKVGDEVKVSYTGKVSQAPAHGSMDFPSMRVVRPGQDGSPWYEELVEGTEVEVLTRANENAQENDVWLNGYDDLSFGHTAYTVHDGQFWPPPWTGISVRTVDEFFRAFHDAKLLVRDGKPVVE